ncbi:Inorganic triphosphatase YgiF, contains CYTH and CHAD domains [Jatrophihabitans endophyticus]|uniref:Inorganic triphosphatase YgiF, contains CYTH and CHAD domains n=1 Tax=Jatrophihabitans endophyticus TaxID=1206085 RepID=A0A1M5DYS5_9ACTN|nr:CYTH and CHAD domain-containing protein [Jatrophihabitans endophyticus]SHF71962.1 Inorganic triphosphatase YgiF, contains CYTH and CHAD domains [Jatrophihabitans endophyticus]
MSTQREREVKFEVPDGFVVPAVADVVRGGEIEERTLQLRSDYQDTAGFDLLAHGLTLRRRSGDDDTGWHLKVPAGDARDEIRLPLTDDDTVPRRLAELVAGIARPEELRPVAVLRTERRVTRVRRGDALVVEIADDRVNATGADGRARSWREIEIELGPAGDERALAAFGRRLTAAGASPSPHASKFARALGRDPHVERSPAGELLVRYLTGSFRRLVAGDVALRRGHDDVVPDTRGAVRRIRSVLRVFADVLDAPTAHALDAELSWYQGLLGEVRDRQRQRVRFAAAVRALPPELVLGPVAAHVDQSLTTEQVRALAAVTDALATNRYRRMLAAVAGLVAGDPVRPRTSRTHLRALADDAATTAAKRLRRAVHDDDPDRLRRARRAIERARDAAELVDRSPRTVARFERALDVLGEHRDAVRAAELARMLGTRAGAAAGENGFTYGLLYQREVDVARRRRRKAVRLRIPH